MTLSVSYPNQNRNYCLFNEQKIANKVSTDFDDIGRSLAHSKTEDEILENLYVINLKLDNGADKNEVSKLYPILSQYNDTTSPNIQTFLAGIYRKTKIPDAFGPLVKMLIQNSINPPKDANFDPTEEIGGAILDYLA